MTAREHAAKAANSGGEAAALYQLSRLEMARSELQSATHYAVESYVISKKAGQYEAAAETFTALFHFFCDQGFDDLAVTPALDLLSIFVQLLGTDVEAARKLGAWTLRAVAPLSQAAREAIIRGFGERYGEENARQFQQQLDAVVAMLEPPK